MQRGYVTDRHFHLHFSRYGMRSVMLQINEYDDDDDDGSLNMKTKHKEADG